MERGLLRALGKGTSQDKTYANHLAKTFAKPKQSAIARRERIFKIESYLRIKRIIQRQLGTVLIGAKAQSSARRVDFANSIVFVPTRESMGVYVRGGTKQQAQEEIVDRITEELGELEYNGQRVFKQVLVKGVVYTGPFVGSAPDILLIPNGFLITPDLGNKIYDIFNTGVHDMAGVFLAYGSNIRNTDGVLTNPKIYDIAPTILHILGVPIPRDIDGRVLKEVFEPRSKSANREILYSDVAAANERKRMKQSIKELREMGKI